MDPNELRKLAAESREWAALPRDSLAQRDRILILSDTLLMAADDLEELEALLRWPCIHDPSE